MHPGTDGEATRIEGHPGTGGEDRSDRRAGTAQRDRRPAAIAWLLVLLGGVAAGWPAAAHASPAGRQTASEGGGSTGAGGLGGPNTKNLEERIAELEALMEKLRAEIEALRASAGRGAGGSGGALTVEELEKRIDALAQEIERLRIGEAAAPPARAPVPGFGRAASKVYGITRGVSIGGYGEMLYQDFGDRRDDGVPSVAQDTLDLERAVFYFGYKWTDHLLFNSEVEYEHAVAGEGEPGETAVEFAYIDYRPYRRFGMRGGLLLVPMGFLTELHEPPVFHGAKRPEVERLIIPSTWRENGLGVYGDLGPVSYRAYVVAGLDASGFTADEGIREGRQEGAESLAVDLALTGRVDWTPAPGLLLGAAAFTGGSGQGNPVLGKARLTLWEAHAEWNARGVHLRGVYARGILGDAEAVSLANDPLLASDPTRGTAIGSRTRGWYAEAAFNLLSQAHGDDRDLSPFVRYESLDTQAEVSPGFSRDPANDRTVRTYGLGFRPIANVAIKVDVQDFGNGAGTGADQVNFALGYLF
jgi:uncharacterized small protein (DUF1192 family)